MATTTITLTDDELDLVLDALGSLSIRGRREEIVAFLHDHPEMYVATIEPFEAHQ